MYDEAVNSGRGMPIMRKQLLSLSSIALVSALCACSSSGSVQPHLSPYSAAPDLPAEQVKTICEGEVVAAMNSQPQRRSATVVVTTRPNTGGFGAGFAQGFNQNYNPRRSIPKSERRSLFSACAARNGYRTEFY